MGSEWPTAPLGELTVNLDTKRRPVKEADRRPGYFPYYGASGIVDYVDSYLFDGEHLLIAEDGENLRTRNTPVAFRATGQFWVNNHAHIVQGNERARTRFLEYAILAADLTPYLTGAVMPKLTQGNLNKIQLPCPSLEEQDAVIGVLGTLDDRIDLLRQTNATLEAIAQALFKSWFVDFDPVRAKMEGREPQGMDAATAALFPDGFEESELGAIPRGWRVVRLEDVAEVVKGRSYKSEELAESDTALVTLKSFARGGGYRPDGLKSFAGTYKAEQIVIPGEVVIACTDVTQAAEVIGRTALVRGTSRYRQLVASLDTLILRPRDSRTTRSLHYLLGTTERFVIHNLAHSTGTTVLHLAKDAVPSFAFACPSQQLVQRFDAIATSLLDRTLALDEESETLAALRDTLLPRLISGKLRLPEARVQVEEAML